MNEFVTQATYVFARAKILMGKGTFILFPSQLIAVGKLYPKLGPIANDNEAKS